MTSLIAAGSYTQFIVVHNFNASLDSYPASTLTLEGEYFMGAQKTVVLSGAGKWWLRNKKV